MTHADKWPRTVNLDGNTASHLAMRLLREEDSKWQGVAVRDRRYPNNIVEQDHRAIKRRCASMLGFKSFKTAEITPPIIDRLASNHRYELRPRWAGLLRYWQMLLLVAQAGPNEALHELYIYSLPPT